ncbi:TonB family protein [Puniceicoccales bacterium CK1056]|uniref:TonB family protein n=1 Tax=Oceanipulchritudo coccoides TaxID=2706888 RepID=A0A6B2M2Q3_9BACT|nr:TonB family protein [Oceanipulchritudo coccoides]NDV62602.1 TonB family protein [Oceanipulchritudo coccoides]
MKKSILFTLLVSMVVLTLGAETTGLRLLDGNQPTYPEELRFSGEDGVVKIRATIDTEGDVSESSIVSATHDAFGEAALEAVKGWKFSPAMKDGKAVSQTVVIPVLFKLSIKDRVNALAGRDVFVDIDSMTDKIYEWSDVKKYFSLQGKLGKEIPYPEELKGSGISEEIVIFCILSPDGYALNPEIINIKNKELALPAIMHLSQLRFSRPKLNGKPIYLKQKVKLLCSEDADPEN